MRVNFILLTINIFFLATIPAIPGDIMANTAISISPLNMSYGMLLDRSPGALRRPQNKIEFEKLHSFQCSYCPYKAKYQDSLRKHMLRIHALVDNP